MRVCHVSTAHGAFDDRIFYKQCKTLAEAGHDVYLIVQSDCVKEVDGVKFISLRKQKSRAARFFISWPVSLIKAIRLKADVYQLHDPDLILLGLILKLLKRKVIFDFHELIYFQLKDKSWIKPKVVLTAIMKVYLFLEEKGIKYFDHIILAEDGYKEYFDSNYFEYKNKCTYVRNYCILNIVDKYRLQNKNEGGKFSLIYIGGLSEIRGIKEIVKAIELINFPLEFVVLGKWSNDEYRLTCQSLSGWEKVKYLGFKRLEEVYFYLNKVDAAFSILYPVKNYMTSLPVKAFEYMAMEKPMIMSDFDYWKDTFKGAAVFVDPYSPKKIAECIKDIYENKTLRKEMGEKGRKLVLNQYSWEVEKNNYLKVFDSIS